MDDWITGPFPPTSYFSLASDKTADKYQTTLAGISYFFLLRSFPVRWQHNLHPPPRSRHQSDSTALHISRRFIIKSEPRVLQNNKPDMLLFVCVGVKWRMARASLEGCTYEGASARNQFIRTWTDSGKKWAVPTLQSAFLIHWLQDQRNKTCTERCKTPWEPLWRQWRH